MIKVTATSDLHGYLPDIAEPFDLLLICGDICPVWEPHTRGLQYEFITDVFAEWVNRLPFADQHSRVILIGGNHDFVFDGISKERLQVFLSAVNDGRLIYLDNEGYEYMHPEKGRLSIFGTPYCKVFGRWAFMHEDLGKYYSAIPDKVDILMSHDAADINGLGLIRMGRQEGVNAGNTVLAEHIAERDIRYYFCGHIHSGRHEMEQEGGTWTANVSLLDERYEQAYEPLTLEIEGHDVDSED